MIDPPANSDVVWNQLRGPDILDIGLDGAINFGKWQEVQVTGLCLGSSIGARSTLSGEHDHVRVQGFPTPDFCRQGHKRPRW